MPQPATITRKAQLFIDANRASPLVYQSASSDEDAITFRLRDGTRFELNSGEARAIDQAGFMPRWAHLEGVTA